MKTTTHINQILDDISTSLEQSTAFQNKDYEIMVIINDGQEYIMKKYNGTTTQTNKNGLHRKVSFKQFFSDTIENDIKLQDSTKKNYFSTLDWFCKYEQEKVLDVTDIDYMFLKYFDTYLASHKLSTNTRGKHFKHLRKIMNEAVRQGLIDANDYPFRKFKIKLQESHRLALTPEELTTLENYSETLQERKGNDKEILDAFLFATYTGLRFSDIKKVKVSDIKTISRKKWLSLNTVKTGVEIKVPLYLAFEGKAVDILRKYHRTRGLLFHIPDNSGANKKLKKIAQACGIKKNISYHIARHTNATLLLYQGLNITTVQKLLGHKDVKTTQIYSAVNEMTIINDFERVKPGRRKGKIKRINYSQNKKRTT